MTVISNSMIALSGGMIFAEVSYILFYVSMDWVSFYLWSFCLKYTDHNNLFNKLHRLVALLLFADSISLILNLVFKHEFSVYTALDNEGTLYYLARATSLYNSHLILDYIVIGAGVIFVISKMIKSHSYYRFRYAIVLTVFGLLIVLNYMYIILNMYLDWSVLLYAIAGATLYFMTIIYTPGRLRNRMMSHAVDDMDEGLILFDIDGNCAYYNEFVKRNFADELDRVIAGDHSASSYDRLIEVSRTDVSQAVIYYENNVGSNFRIRLEPLIDAKEHNLGSFFLIEDITEETRMMNELKEAREAADKASEYKSTFLANMSHEIRTPINAVLGMNEMILRECEDKDILSYAENIKASGGALLDLINDILDFSKIEAGKMELIDNEYGPKNMIKDTYMMLRRRATDKGLRFGIKFDEEIPAVLLGDEKRIRQVLSNILSNAIKYTKEGSVNTVIRFERIDDDNISLVMEISDTGIGISEENQKVLFDSFQRVDMEHNRNIEGTGLGLAITKQIVEMMQGSITVTSEVGKGSNFTVSIPQRVLDNKPSGKLGASTAEMKEKYKVTFTAPDAKILVVDDVELNIMVVTGLLKNTKVMIDSATKGMEAYEMCKNIKYDLILMDHMMPYPDGVETFRMIREEGLNKDTKVVVLTANAISGVEEEYRAIGFDGYLSKPVKGADLEGMLEQFLPKELVIMEE